MDTDMQKFLEILEAMGATNISFTEKNGDDDILYFEFDGNKVCLFGRHCNDGTGGIGADVD